MKKAYLLVLTIYLFGSISVFSQQFDDEDYVFLKRYEKISINLKGSKFDIKRHVTEQAKYNTANKMQFASEVIPFDAFSEITNIDAFTYLPDLDKKVPVDYIETKRVFDNGIFFSDQQFKAFTFPAVKKGAVTELNYTEEIKDPHFLGVYRFGTYVPTASGVLEVEFPKNVEIGYVDFNTDKVTIDFSKSEGKDKNSYRWEISNIDGFQSEDGSEEALHIIPHIIVYVKGYENKGKKVNVLNSEADLYNWYVTLVDQIDENNLDEVYAIADRLTKGLTSQTEKAKAIFNWVQDNITYVAFEDGLGGFIPRGAASVCNKKYGDCKDMANLLFEMLNHSGITAHRAWIGTRNRPYKYKEVPTPMVDNHMITAAIIDGETIFLDATDSYVPFGLPSAFTQTKEALLGIDENSYNIVVVPTVSSEKNMVNVTSEMRIEGNSLLVDEQRTLTGYEKVDFLADYTYKKDDKTEEEFLNIELQLGNNKTSYSNITMQSFDNSADPLLLSYDLKIDNYAKLVSNKLIVNLNIDKTLSRSKIDIENRKYSKKIDHQFEKEFKTVLQIPEGYDVTSLPKPLAFENEHYGFSITHEQKDGKIVQSKKLYVKTLSVKKPEFEQWNAFIKSIIKAYKKSIILEKTT